MEHSAWVDQLLDRVRERGEEGEAAMQYVRTHKTQIGFKRIRPSVGHVDRVLKYPLEFHLLHVRYAHR
jgi:hypothetical protein